MADPCTGSRGRRPALPLMLTACGGSSGSGSRSIVGGARRRCRSGAPPASIYYWLWDSNQLPAYQACADAFHTAIPGGHREDQAVRLGRLLGQDQCGFTAGTGAGRVHRPPVEVPGVRAEAADPRPRSTRSRPTRSIPTSTRRVCCRCGPRQDGKSTGCRRTSTPSACSTTPTDRRRRVHRPDLADAGLEPDRRWHLREVHRAPDRRQQRQARRRARLRQEQHQDLRLQPRGRPAATARPSGARSPAATGGSTPTRTRGAPTTTTTSPSSRTP